MTAFPVIKFVLLARKGLPLFDAAVRLTTRSTGLWAITLPGGAAVTAAAIHFLDQARAGDDTWTPALLLTAAWFFRVLCQGAASLWVQQLLVGPGEPSTTRSFLEGLKRLPSLAIATVVLGAGNTLIATFTLGLGLFFFNVDLAGYAAVMQGKGHPVAIWSTASRLLGPARRTANGGFACLLLTYLVVVLNLHLGTQVGLSLSQSLLGLDLTFATRYASLDNPTWVLSLAALTFALVEPLRAALGTLLLLDGQVRQEGLDLLSAVEQLPSRARPARSAAAAVALALLALAAPARAQDDGEDARPPSVSDLITHTEGLAKACEVALEDVRPRLDALHRLDPDQRVSYQRFLDRLGWYVDDEECEDARALLFHSLDQVQLVAAAPQASHPGPESASVRARAILDRPEFQQPAPRKATPKEEVKKEGESAWDRFWRQVGEWLRELFRPRRDARAPEVQLAPGGGEAIANGLAIALVAGVLVALAVLVLRRRGPGQGVAPELDVVSAPLAAATQESALSRPPEGWAALADELAARGQYREAVRGLYLAALSRLHLEGALDYDPSLSNWDHVRRYKGPPPWKPPFRELTLRFDFVFYGNVGGTADGYRDFRALCRPLLDHAAPTA